MKCRPQILTSLQIRITLSDSQAPETETPETENATSETVSDDSFHLRFSEGDNETFEEGTDCFCTGTKRIQVCPEEQQFVH